MNSRHTSRFPFHQSITPVDLINEAFQNITRDSVDSGFTQFNIIKQDENNFVIHMSVPGFDKEDIEITSEESKLVVAGKHDEETKDAQYLHRGFTKRSFRKEFGVPEYFKIKGADMANGMLTIGFEKVIPEDKKSTKIEIN